MSVEKITEKILSDAQAEVQRIQAEIAKKAEKIQNEGREQAAVIGKEAEEEAKRRAQDQKSKDIATAELELRKALLAQKQELIQQVFDKALKHLANLKGQEYQRFVTELLLKVVEVGDEEVVFSSSDGHKIGEKLLEEVNGRLAKEGRKGSLRIVREDRDLQGGFILRRGKMEVNCSLQALFNTVREELEPQVSKILFS
jgi:V/A-type H+-transporting ATPase subunit E